jgi:hypothetical protein
MGDEGILPPAYATYVIKFIDSRSSFHPKAARGHRS